MTTFCNARLRLCNSVPIGFLTTGGLTTLLLALPDRVNARR